MLCEIFRLLNVDDEVSIKNIYEQYEGINLGFVINQKEDDIVLEVGDHKEATHGWPFFHVALALKANRTALWVLKT